MLALVAAMLAGGVLLPAQASAMPTAADIDALLQANGSPMAGMGAAFVTTGIRYGIDPAFLVAISGAESSFGRLLYSSGGDVATFNAWNWFYAGTRASSDFSSWAQGLDRVAAGLTGPLYYGAGLYGVLDIAPRYCPVGTQPWINNVSAFMMALGGDPNDTRLASSTSSASGLGPSLALQGSVQLTGEPYYLGRRLTATFTVTNSGGAVGTWTGMTLTLTDADGTARSLGSGVPFTLGPGETKTFTGSWVLQSLGVKTGSIAATSDVSAQTVGARVFAITVTLSPQQKAARLLQARRAQPRLHQ